MKYATLAAIVVLGPLLASAQLRVIVSPIKIAGEKAVVPLSIRNKFAEKVESARAVAFLLDGNGNVVGQGTRWVIGGNENKPGLPSGATNSFNFVMASDKPFATTNLTATIVFNRIVLEGGKLADVNKDVHVQN